MLTRFRSLCFHRHMPRGVPDNDVLEPANENRKEDSNMYTFRIWFAVSQPTHIPRVTV